MAARPQTRGARRVAAASARDPKLLRARDGGGRRARPWYARLWPGLRAGAIAIALLGSGWYVQDVMTTGEAFSVQDLRVIGAVRLSEGEVFALLDGLKGRNIVTTSLEPWRARLLSSPWVRDASLRRALPGTIEVRITERVPMAVARAGDELFLVDEQGTVVDEFGPRYGALDLPIVDGLLESGQVEQATLDDARVAVLGQALASFRQGALLGRVSQIDVSDARNVNVTLVGDPARLALGHDRFAERVQAYLDMGERLTRMVQQVDSVDLRFDNRVYVRPRKPGITFASLPQVSADDTVEEALAEPDDDGQE